MDKLKKWLPLIVVGLFLLWGYSSFKGFNNTAVTYQEDAKTAWSNVESSYQRRADLIPKTLKFVFDFEQFSLHLFQSFNNFKVVFGSFWLC